MHGAKSPDVTVHSVCCAQIDQAALTGESLPAKKFSGDVAFSGSAIKQGERHAVVYATGANTFFGRAANLIGNTHNVANIQKVNFQRKHTNTWASHQIISSPIARTSS